MAGEAASLWTKVHERINAALSSLIGLYPVTAVEGSAVTIDINGASREVTALRGADIRPDDIALVVFIGREGIAVNAVGGA